MTEGEKDVQAYLARIRRTVADANDLVSQAELRIAETDRMLERQGLTREQVMSMRFTEAQIAAANEELKRRGLDPLERWELEGREAQGEPLDAYRAPEPEPGGEVADRRRKFSMMMKPFQL